MKLCYQVATPDVAIADSVTAYQGPLEKSFSDLAKLGYQGVELMTLNPSELDWEFVKCEAEKTGLKVVLVCTGEIFGQLGLSYTNPDPENRKEAIRRSKEIIDFAAYLGANINIGRVRGQYCKELTREQTEELARHSASWLTMQHRKTCRLLWKPLPSCRRISSIPARRAQTWWIG